jgi:hypothetical protein
MRCASRGRSSTDAAGSGLLAAWGTTRLCQCSQRQPTGRNREREYAKPLEHRIAQWQAIFSPNRAVISGPKRSGRIGVSDRAAMGSPLASQMRHSLRYRASCAFWGSESFLALAERVQERAVGAGRGAGLQQRLLGRIP